MDPSRPPGYLPPVSKKPAKSDEHELSFEEALAQVESIIERIEGGQVGLEASVAEYEKGVALIRRCRDVLTKAEQRVEQLNKDLLDQAKLFCFRI